MIPQKETFWASTEGWFEHRRLTTCINTKVRPQSQVQYGGTALMAINKCAYSISSVQPDDRNLGRWTSILFRGKNQHLCRIICAYCPCKSTGPTSTYAMQVVGLMQEQITECPRKQFWTDLKLFISKCTEQKEHVIVMGDWNSHYPEVVQWMEQLNLVDILSRRHGHVPPPPTCKRSSAYPLDAIFVPASFTCWRGGYLAYEKLEGDHRGIWCDIPIEYILGCNMHHSPHFKARRLKTADPRTRKRYVQTLHTELTNRHIYERFDQLMISPSSGLLPTEVLQFESLDKEITAAMELSERKCRKLNTGEVKWSPLYQKACDRVTYWHMVQKEAEGGRINVRKLRSLRKKLGLQRKDYTLPEISSKVKEAIQNRKKCKKYAPELQAEYRYRLALALEKENKIPAATHVRNLSHQEDTRVLFRRIRYMERKIMNLSTTRLSTRTSRGKRIDLVQKAEVERCIIQENIRIFHQTEGTGQLQKGRLLKDLGSMGEGPKVDALLSGEYAPPWGLSRHTKDFLSAMGKPQDTTPVQPITFQEFKAGWNKTKERTSSNGPHFGHYKASMFHPQISMLLYKRALIPMVTGYAPRRHRQGIDVMLLKKENIYEVDRLRTIVLFDSEANMNYKHLGRRAMQAAISKGQIATEQYSRPQRKAIDHALNRRLIIDHQQYLRQPYALTSYDLKGCYDRINHTSASLALQRIGIAKSEVLSMFTSIQYMTHRVRTAFGDSAHTYGGMGCDENWKLPPQGVLQGNGSGPAIWSILSSCIFDILRRRGHCNTISSSIRKLLLELSGFAYVDDTDLLQIDDTVDEVVRHMQQKVLDWNDNIGVTGGILSPEKCWWYLVTFQYVAGKWKAVSPQEDFKLWLKNESKK
jgi:Reverse transcriptase (RNA-dependent DNA polymerase).